MATEFQRGDSTFHRLADGTDVEHDAATGWTGVSRFSHGLATGRPSPSMAVRPRAITSILEAHSMLPSHGGPGQGMLFEPETRSVHDVLSEHGVPDRRASSGDGFLSRLGSVAGAATQEARDEVANRKAEVIRQAGHITSPSVPGRGPERGYPGTATPMKLQLENLKAHESENVTGNWYDDEADDIDRLAGVHNTSHARMRRGVALLSPQKPWTTGASQDATHKMPNLEAGSAVASRVLAGAAGAAKLGHDFDYTESGALTRVSAANPKYIGEEVMPQSAENLGKAGAAFDPKNDPASRIVTGSEPKMGKKGKLLKTNMAGEKVPSFDLALAAGSASPTVNREAAQAVTIDTHAGRAAGIPDYTHIGGGGKKPKDLPEGVTSNPYGQYDVSAMLVRRRALQRGVLPNYEQQHTWRVGRGTGSQAVSQQMFNGLKGIERVTGAARPVTERTSRPGEFDNSEFLKRMDEERF